MWVAKTNAEAAWILEAIRTGNPDRAADNLEFLLKAGLLDNAKLECYLKERQPGKGPALPVIGAMNAVEAPDTAIGSGCVCPKP